MFTYSFNNREKVLLVILACMLIGVFYYFVVQVPVTDRIMAAQALQADAEDNMVIESSKATKMKKMQAVIDAADSNTLKAEIPQYNNIKNVMVQLDNIVGSATTDYNISFSQITTNEGLVYRPINMSFDCANYAAAKNIILNLNNCQYRCMIDSVSIEPESSSNESIAASPVTVSLTITFIEKN